MPGGFPHIVAGLDGLPSPYMFESARRFRQSFSPFAGGYTVFPATVNDFPVRKTPGSGIPAHVHCSTNNGVLTLVCPLRISQDITPGDLPSHPTLKLVTLKRIRAQYYRESSDDTVSLRISRQTLSGDAVSSIASYTSTEMSTTGSWSELDVSVDLILDETTYDYFIELVMDPNGASGDEDDSAFGPITLEFEQRGLRFSL